MIVLSFLLLYLKTIIIFSKLNPLSYKDGNVSSTQSYPDPTSALAPQTTLPWVSLVAKMASCRRTDPTTDKPSPTKTTFDLLESSWYHPTQIHMAPIRDSQVSNNIPLPPQSHLDPLASPWYLSTLIPADLPCAPSACAINTLLVQFSLVVCV